MLDAGADVVVAQGGEAELHRLAADHRRAVADDDVDVAQVVVGEAVALVQGVLPAADVVASLVAGACTALRGAACLSGTAELPELVMVDRS